jgi:3-oxoacyl-[acyl-carrier protein] reductase
VGDLDFSGKTVLVVGGSSGIGNAIGQAFRRRFASVVVCGTRPSAAEYADSPDSDFTGMQYAQLDVSDPLAVASWQAPVDTLDVLVLCQGMVLYERREFQPKEFRRVVDVNLVSLMACAERFHASLRESRGSLIVVSSTAAFQSTRGNPAYNASKAGAVGLTRALGDAWATEGIRVNGIAPGMVATKMTAVTTSNPKRLAAILGSIPLGRLGTCDEIAGVALFLASPLASYILGQTIPVDGGLLLR